MGAAPVEGGSKLALLSAETMGLYSNNVAAAFNAPLIKLKGRNTLKRSPVTTSRVTPIYSGVMSQFHSSMVNVIHTMPVTAPMIAAENLFFFLYITDIGTTNAHVDKIFIRKPMGPVVLTVIISKNDTTIDIITP